MDFKIFQLKQEHLHKFGFRNLPNNVNTVDLGRYNCVYAGKLDVEDVDLALERIFEVFNIDHPKDFKGRSLSVSDIVLLNGKCYYCCNTGWAEVQTN